ncbi:MAG: ATP-binding protein, partial [Planctomycetota bacterium]
NNAVLHHDRDQGRVEISGGRESRESLWIRVRDDGPGIDPERREEAFRMFSSLGTQAEGSGMGLAFVRRAARALGGTVEIEEVAGRGASLLVSLPFEAAAPVES